MTDHEDRELRALRLEMDGVNAELCAVVQRRGRLACAIADRKTALGLPLQDPDREEAMLAQVAATPAGAFDRAELSAVFRCVLATTRAMLARRIGHNCR
jgi:chorismate mutase